MAAEQSTYEIGQVVTLRATFRKDGELADPDTVSLHVKPPAGPVEQLQPTRQSKGVWQANYDLEGKQAGWYLYLWESSGAVKTAHEARFLVLQRYVVYQ
jgi:hypothetical protein